MDECLLIFHHCPTDSVVCLGIPIYYSKYFKKVFVIFI